MLSRLLFIMIIGKGGSPHLAPDGSYVGGNPTLAPDGSYVGGKPQMAPDGKYVGDGSNN